MEKNNLSLPVLIFSFAFFAMVLAILIHSYSTYEEIKAIDMRITMGDYVGFNLETKYLEFGTTMPQGSSERSMELYNPHNFPLFVEIEIIPKKDLDNLFKRTKPIKEEWVTISQNYFILNSDEKKSIKFTIKPAEDAGYGNYTAQALIKFRYIE